MLRQTREKDLALFINYANIDVIESYDDIPTSVLIPSFIISELKTAFQIGFILFIPFLVIDMIVASTLMAMGTANASTRYDFFCHLNCSYL